MRSNILPEFLRNIKGLKEMPVGFIARVEPHHIKFFNGASPVKYLLLKINHADRLLNKGLTADSYFDPKYSIITTSTIHDKHLTKLQWEKERDIVLQFSPDFHIPTDYPVYSNMSDEDRIHNIKECTDGTKWIAEELSQTKTKILPLIKGVNKQERNICYKTFIDLKINYCVFYGAQYFGSGIGNQFSQLYRDIKEITSEFPHCGIFIIGLQSPDYLKKLPPQVIAAAGNKWFKYRDVHGNTKRFNEELCALKNKVENKLGVGQTSLVDFGGDYNG